MNELYAGQAMRNAGTAYAYGGHAARSMCVYLSCGFNLLQNLECLRERKQIYSASTEHNRKERTKKKKKENES